MRNPRPIPGKFIKAYHTNIIVRTALDHYQAGHCSYVTALEEAVLLLVRHNDALDKITQRDMERQPQVIRIEGTIPEHLVDMLCRSDTSIVPETTP